MITISLCMIVKNEAGVLERCLADAKDIADEIILVDTGSTDETVDIARRFTDQIYDFPWIDDFAAARNFSFSKASMDYCMWLDADDRILPQDQEALLKLKEELDPATDVVMMRYHASVNSTGKPLFTYYRERIVRNRAGFVWAGAVHEAITPRGRIVYSDIAITHDKVGQGDPDRNLRIYERQLAQGVALDLRGQFYYGRELYYHARYQDAIRVLEGFLTDPHGYLENQIEACRVLGWCYRALDDREGALRSLLASLRFDTPRAEVCCDIGQVLMDMGRYRQAIFWYETALARPRNDNSGAFVLPECYGYLPSIQLCLCYDKLGDLAAARRYNDLAGQYRPDSASYAYNKAYFQRKTQSASQ